MKRNILKEIVKLRNRIAKLQKECPHENVVVTPGSNTGNYDLTEIYWVDVKCFDCDIWERYDSEDDPKEYRKYLHHNNK